MAAKVRVVYVWTSANKPREEWGREFRCPGCVLVPNTHPLHCVPTVGPKAWGYNGSLDAPTFTPSILFHPTTHGTPEAPIRILRCHSVVTSGRIFFCQDSEHPLAGQTVDLPDW